jgi:uncharacterized peroxidase-related enzyme
MQCIQWYAPTPDTVLVHTEVPFAHKGIQPRKDHTMNRIPLLNAEQAPASSQAVLTQIQQAFGATPNMFKAIAHSPAALRSMWGSFGALSQGVIDAQLGEQIAVAVADLNACAYCLAAHTALGGKAGVSSQDLRAAQQGESPNPRTASALRFALKLVNERGQINDSDVQALRDAGFTNEHIVEILAHVALNLFTNYVNVAFAVPIDFPDVPLSRGV